MTSGEIALRQAAASMADRMRVFKRISNQAREAERRIDLDPRELWEQADEQALSNYEDALNKINGAQPLPFEEISA